MQMTRFALVLAVTLAGPAFPCATMAAAADGTDFAALGLLKLSPEQEVLVAKIDDNADIVGHLGHSKDEWAQASRLLQAAIADPIFPDLPKPKQARAYSGAAWAAIRVDDQSAARDFFAKSLELNPDVGSVWYALAQAETWLGHSDAAALALTGYAKRWEFDPEDRSFVGQVIRSSTRGSEARFGLLQALFDGAWDGNPEVTGALWFELALAHLHRNQNEQAKLVIAQINSVEGLVKLLSDKRFDSVVDPKAAQFDVLQASQRQIAQLREDVGDSVTPSQSAADLARALLVAGDFAGVDAFTSRLLAQDFEVDAEPEVLRYRASLAENRAFALMALGRDTEAVAQMEAAARITTGEHVNVNQTLDLAGMYCDLGRGKETRETAARVTQDMNDYGQLVKSNLDHCAAVQLGDKPGAAKDLDYMRDHRQLAPGFLMWAYLRERRLDEAAAELISRLEDEDTRSDVLFQLQDFLESDHRAANQQIQKDWAKLKKRRDVQKALDQVGRIRHYDLYL